MPRFAANLTMLFTEVPFLDRFEAAAKAGFTAVEYLFPYDFPAGDLVTRLQQHGLTQVLHNLPAGNWGAGERGIACHPDRVAEFRDGVTRAVEYARALTCPQVNCLAGIVPAGVSPAVAQATFVTNLRFAADLLSAAGIRLLIEPINTRDIPGFFLTQTKQALAIIEDVGAPAGQIAVQYDVYHMQIMEGDLAKTIERHLPQIGHIQIADPPLRHEPGTGEINYRYLLNHIDRLGYTGYIGLEYKPAGRTEDGLRWIGEHGFGARA